jgi:hypothetical protein
LQVVEKISKHIMIIGGMENKDKVREGGVKKLAKLA